MTQEHEQGQRKPNTYQHPIGLCAARTGQMCPECEKRIKRAWGVRVSK